MEGESSLRMKTRSDVDRFDAQFEGEGRAAEEASRLSSSEGEEEEEQCASQDIDANKVSGALCMLSASRFSFVWWGELTSSIVINHFLNRLTYLSFILSILFFVAFSDM